MLDYLKGKVSDRKLRLFACACARLVWHLLNDTRSRDAVEVAERFADGLATVEELDAARNVAWAAARNVAWAAAWNAAWDAAWAAAWNAARVAARARQASLLRDIFGNPFSPVVFSMPAHAQVRSDLWGLAHGLAREVYEERQEDYTLNPVQLSILADALEEAGCDQQELLTHLRSPGQHYRGMWSLDLILGKE